MNAEWKRGMKETIPIVIGLIPFALILGAQATQKGMSVLELCLMMGLNFAGGSEFAAVNAWTSPLPIVLIWTLTLMINCRHVVMGAAWVSYLRTLPLRQVLPVLFVMTDESWAMTTVEMKKREQEQPLDKMPSFNLAYYWGTAMMMYGSWIVCGFLGAKFGYLLGDHLDEYGFGMAFPAVFLVLVRGMWRGVKMARPWVVSLVVAALVYWWQPNGGWYVLAGTLSGLMVAYFGEEVAV